MSEKKQNRKKIFGLIFIALAAVLICSAAVLSGQLEEIESRTWDWRLRSIAATTVPDPTIKLIVIDQSSLDHFAKNDSIFWPWYREMYVAVIKYLQRAGARGVAFDILFTEPSSYGVEDDAALRDALDGPLPVILGAALRTSEAAAIDAESIALFKDKQAQRKQLTDFDRLYLQTTSALTFPGVTLPIVAFLKNSTAIGNVSASPDKDGVFRHCTAGGYFQGAPLLGLPFALYDAASGEKKQEEFLHKFLDERGQLAVRFSGGARSYKTYGIDSIIVSQRQFELGQPPAVSPEEFKDAWVFVGMDAPGLLDLRPTPLSAVLPGVEYNATVLDNLLNASFIRKTPAIVNILISSLLAILATGICFIPLRGRMQFILIIFLFFAYSYATVVAGQMGYWIPLVIPLCAMLFSLIAALGFQYQSEGRQRRIVRNAFQHYVSASVIERILEDPANLTLGGEKREVTVFFSDIQGFTSISESLEASALGQFLNYFLSEMTDIILEHGGTVDKYVGDAIIAFWNAPLPVDDHAARAVHAAVACQKRILDIAPQVKADFGVDIKMRIGLCTGVASVGNFGSKKRFNYTVIGDAVNLASRLEGANKNFGTLILMSETTQQSMKDAVPVRRIARIRVVGKTEAVAVYEPLPDASKADLEKMGQGLELFEKGDVASAQASFAAVPNSSLAQAYLRRIAQDLELGQTGKAWSPIWNLTEK